MFLHKSREASHLCFLSNPALRLVQCARVNSAADANCKACGAARWDGDDGQLAARVSAILQVSAVTCETSPEWMQVAVHMLPACCGGVCTDICSQLQTSDLDAITLSSVVQRLEAESGNAPSAGLQFAQADVKQEVDRQLSLSASLVLQGLLKHLVECCDVPFHALTSGRAIASLEAVKVGNCQECCSNSTAVPSSWAGAQRAQMAGAGRGPASAPAAAEQPPQPPDGERQRTMNVHPGVIQSSGSGACNWFQSTA